MSKLNVCCWSHIWACIHVLFVRKIFFQLMEDIDEKSKQLKEKCNHRQLNHFNYCPVPQQRHQICCHSPYLHFHHCVVLSFEQTTNLACGTCRALVNNHAHLIEKPAKQVS